MPSLKLLLRKMVPVKCFSPNEIIAYTCFQDSVKIKRENYIVRKYFTILIVMHSVILSKPQMAPR